MLSILLAHGGVVIETRPFVDFRMGESSNWCSYTVTGPVLELVEEEYIDIVDFLDCATLDPEDIIEKTVIAPGNEYCRGYV